MKSGLLAMTDKERLFLDTAESRLLNFLYS
jgi:hypothetical protein